MRIFWIFTIGFFCFFLLPISCKKQTFTLQEVQSQKIAIDSTVPENLEISEFIKPFKESVDKEMDSVIAYAPKSYTKKDSKFNTAIGNMMADAVYELANPIFQSRTGYPFQAVLLNYGGIRSPLNKGPVSTRSAYQIMPFENQVIVVELSGYQLKELFDYLSYGTAHPISGMQVILNKDGSLKEATIQGEKVIDNETYFIATTDYLHNGGDNMTFLTQPVSKLELGYKVRNILIDYFKKRDTIAPSRDHRFIKEQ